MNKEEKEYNEALMEWKKQVDKILDLFAKNINELNDSVTKLEERKENE